MYPARIENYHRPTTCTEALAAMQQYDEGDAVFVAGGQSIMQAMKSRMLQPGNIIDLQAVEELKGIKRSGNSITIGAMTRYVEIASDPLLDPELGALADAAAHVGDRQVRNRGTLGGSLCWNYVASCSPAATLGVNGQVELLHANGSTRKVAIDDFLLGPLETAREEQELLTAVSFDLPQNASGSAYKKWGLVRDALPVVGVCVMVELDGSGTCSAARIAFSGLANGATRATDSEAALVGLSGDEGELKQAFETISNNVETHDDASANADFRRQLIRTLGVEVAQSAFSRALAR